MRRRRALGAAVATLAIAVGSLSSGAGAASTTATGALSDSHVRRAPVSARVAEALAPRGEMRGMSLNDVGLDNRGLAAVTLDFPRMALEGITSVAVYVYLYVPDPRGSAVSSGPLTPTDQELQLVAEAARQQGLRLQLMPVLLDTATNGWRGSYLPDDVDAFFASYTTQVLHYATLAQQLGVSLFYVGSENDKIAGCTAQWLALIAKVRQAYSGAISYLSTVYTPPNVKFWKQLDLASISPYFALGEEATPSYDRIRRAWADVHTPYIRKLVKALGMPLVYGEVGYHSQQGSFSAPAGPGESVDKLAAPAAQADAYAALLDVLAGEPGVYGVTWWRWSPASLSLDTSYSPANKPAECVLATHWSQDATVRSAAGLPVCEQHTLDAALLAVSSPLSQALNPR